MAIHLITGDDESLLPHRSVRGRAQFGDGDRSLMRDEFDDQRGEVRSVVTPPKLRHFSPSHVLSWPAGSVASGAQDVAPLVAYLADPLPSTELVLVAGGGRVAKALTDAVKNAGGHVIDTVPTDARCASVVGGCRGAGHCRGFAPRPAGPRPAGVVARTRRWPGAGHPRNALVGIR